jgi:hypothetical protein
MMGSWWCLGGLVKVVYGMGRGGGGGGGGCSTIVLVFYHRRNDTSFLPI